jgi:hypothetical protein
MGTDLELQSLIRRWSAPAPSSDLDRRMMTRYRSVRGWHAKWRRFLRARLSVPIPLIAAVLLLAGCLLLPFFQKPNGPGERMAGFEPVASPQLIVTRAEVTQ